jgi:hypothetical protein
VQRSCSWYSLCSSFKFTLSSFARAAVSGTRRCSAVVGIAHSADLDNEEGSGASVILKHNKDGK